MHIFLDFDDVVFNTKQFIADLKKKLCDIYVFDPEVFQQCYYDKKTDKATTRVYSLDAHLHRITEQTQIPFANLKETAVLHICTAHQYVFSDMAQSLRQYGKYTTLLSYGDSTFQKDKINNSHITRYIQSTIITTELKSKVIKNEHIKNNHFYFIDDRIHHIEAIKKAFPYATTIFVQREEGRYATPKTDFVDHVANNGNEIFSLLQRGSTKNI